MKNAMKKLTSLLLVAVLLVGALPFGASAASAVTVVVIDNADDAEYRFEKTPSNPETGAKAADLLNYWAKNTAGVESASATKYYAYPANGSKGEVGADHALFGGDSIRIRADIVWTSGDEGTDEEIPDEEIPDEEIPDEEIPDDEITDDENTDEGVAAPATIKVVVKVGSSDNVVKTIERVPANGEYAVVENILTHWYDSEWKNTYKTSYKAWSSKQQAVVDGSAKIYAGDTLSILLTKKSASSSNNSTESNTSNDIVASTKDQNDIFLNIFINKDFNNCKTVKLNDHWTIADDKITTYEVLNYIVTDYYKASNTNLGLQCDGLYYSVGSFMYNWLLDNAAVKTDAVDNISVKRANGTVTINIMVTNATAKTSTSTADSSNPKTGDSIYTAFTVMGVSAAALASVMYFYNKKRMAL